MYVFPQLRFISTLWWVHHHMNCIASRGSKEKETTSGAPEAHISHCLSPGHISFTCSSTGEALPLPVLTSCSQLHWSPQSAATVLPDWYHSRRSNQPEPPLAADTSLFPLPGNSQNPFPPSRRATVKLDQNLSRPFHAPLGKVSVLPKMETWGSLASEIRNDHVYHFSSISMWILKTTPVPDSSLSTPGPYHSDSLAHMGSQPRHRQSWHLGKLCPSLKLNLHTLMLRFLLTASFPLLGWKPSSHFKSAHLCIWEFSITQRESRLTDTKENQLAPFPHHPLDTPISQWDTLGNFKPSLPQVSLCFELKMCNS